MITIEELKSLPGTATNRLRLLWVMTRGRLQLLRKHTEARQVICFHHIPKCAGTSLLSVLSSNYYLIKDYRLGWSGLRLPPVKLNRLNANYCLCGHFEPPSHQIFERYPSLDAKGSFLFCFVREPFDLMCSLYRYELMSGAMKYPSFSQFLISNSNYLSNFMGVPEYGIDGAINKYQFIGLFEEFNESIKRLSHELGVTFPAAGRLNTSKHISLEYGASDREVFEEHFQTDIELYRECQKRFLAS